MQLLVIGFGQPDFEGEVAAGLARLPESDTVKVIDAMVVYKDGALSVTHLDTLTEEDRVEYGAILGALLGLGFDGEEGLEAGAQLGLAAASEGIDVVEENADWDDPRWQRSSSRPHRAPLGGPAARRHRACRRFPYR